jgi:hypothetical protein
MGAKGWTGTALLVATTAAAAGLVALVLTIKNGLSLGEGSVVAIVFPVAVAWILVGTRVRGSALTLVLIGAAATGWLVFAVVLALAFSGES